MTPSAQLFAPRLSPLGAPVITVKARSGAQGLPRPSPSLVILHSSPESSGAFLPLSRLIGTVRHKAAPHAARKKKDRPKAVFQTIAKIDAQASTNAVRALFVLR
jgi:hypothetical protein